MERELRHAGWFNRDAPDVGTGEVSASDGTMTRIQVRIDAETERVEEAVFKVVGEDAAIACANLVTERLQGVHVADAKQFEELVVVAELQLPLDRANVAGLAVEAAKKAIEDWERKRGHRV